MSEDWVEAWTEGWAESWAEGWIEGWAEGRNNDNCLFRGWLSGQPLLGGIGEMAPLLSTQIRILTSFYPPSPRLPVKI